jgi:hypothetical protein
MTCRRLYSCDTILKRLAPHFQDLAAARRPFIRKGDPVVCQRHLAGHRHLAPVDQPHIRDRVVWGATGARRDERRAVAGEAGDTMDAGGFDGLREGHIRQDGGESARQH